MRSASCRKPLFWKHRIFLPEAPQFPHANKVLSCPAKILTSRNKMCLWEKRRRRKFPYIFRFACLMVGKKIPKIFDGDLPYTKIRKESPKKQIQAVDITMTFFSIGFFTLFQVKVPGSNDIRWQRCPLGGCVLPGSRSYPQDTMFRILVVSTSKVPSSVLTTVV